jgi:hypothetical protein
VFILVYRDKHNIVFIHLLAVTKEKMNRKIVLLIGLLLIVVSAVAAVLVKYSPDHPILLKYATFRARSLGPPLQADVYTDGELNNSIKVFANGDSSILLYLEHTPPGDRVILINWEHNLVGTPVGAGINDHDFLWGRLFRSEVGGIIVPFNSVKMSQPFNPDLKHRGNEITFVIARPADEEFDYRFRTVRIIMKSNS